MGFWLLPDFDQSATVIGQVGDFLAKSLRLQFQRDVKVPELTIKEWENSTSIGKMIAQRGKLVT